MSCGNLVKAVLVVALSLMLTAPLARAQNKIRAAYSSISGIFTPVWIATDERLYQKYQTDADLVYIGGSSVAVSALIAGEIDFIYGGADPIISGILAGADLTLAGFISNTTPISLYVVPGYSKVEELKGKTVAVTRLASSTAYMAKVAFAQSKLEPIKDIPLIGSGGYPESLGGHAGGARCRVRCSRRRLPIAPKRWVSSVFGMAPASSIHRLCWRRAKLYSRFR